MYEQFYGLKYDPFRLTPSGRDVYAHPSFERARAYLEYGLLRSEGFVVVTGPPGSGKTTLIRELLARLPAGTRHAEIETSRLSAEDLLRMVLSRFSIKPPAPDKASIIEALRNGLLSHARGGGRSLLVVDEAQDLHVDALEELRLLTNLVDHDTPLLQIVLLGQPGLRDLIRRPELEQFHQRTVASCRLRPLTEEQSIEFVRFRLERAGWQGDPVITTAALQLVHTAAEGIPRRLNLLTSRMLLHGFAEARHSLGVEDVVYTLEEMEDEAVGSWQDRIAELTQAESQERHPVAPTTADDDPAAAGRPNPATPAMPAGAGAPGPAPRSDRTGGDGRDAAPAVPPEAPLTAPPREAAPGRAPARTDELADHAADVVIPEPEKPADWPPRPAAGRRRESAPPPATRRSGHRPVMVVVSIAVAVFAVALVLVATTPVGDRVEARVHAWVDSLRSMAAEPASPGERASPSELPPQ